MSVKTENRETTIIGIDGGGTRTRGVLFKNGEVIAKSFAGTTRVGTVGVGESCERLLNVIADLCAQAKIDSVELDAVVIGLAGVWLEEEKKRSSHLLKTLARGQKITLNDLTVISDAELALEGAFDGDEGITLIVGTGSIGIGKVNKKNFARCGGWGIELDDEGSGAWIGKEGLTAIVRSIDGRGNKTALTQIFADSFPNIDLDNPRTIVKAYADRSFEYHMLTPLVMQCADNGDEVCLEIIQRAAYHLMEIFGAIIKNYKSKTVDVALMGGIIENNTLLAKMLYDRVDKHDRLNRIEPKGTALDGALKIAYKMIEEGYDF
jgi:N-acetylglucosamine kinase-like BadF-type ATPase